VSELIALVAEPLIKIIVLISILLPTVLYLVLLERWIAAWIQDRLGPNRVGPMGLGHAIADAFKLLFKEDVIPNGVDKPLYLLAPAIIVIPALCTIAVIPFADTVTAFGHTVRLQIADVNIGVLYILSIASLGVYGIVLGGWSSNSKYAFLGGIRSAAQLLSYEPALVLAVLGVVMLAGSLQLDDIVVYQSQTYLGVIPRWNIFVQPLAFVVFMTCAFAETNRAPFDVAEAEQELVAGYHTEYSSMKWVLFFVAEYSNMVVSSALMATLFFGGWHFPYLAEPVGSARDLLGGGILGGLVKVGVFCAKTGAFLFVFMWVRWTLPRFKFNQIMSLAWKVLVPLALANIAAVALTLYLFARPGPDAGLLPTVAQVVLMALNVAGFALVLFVIPWLSRATTARRPAAAALAAAA
jgi:NADH-quinone oxidoreductase subunit H